MPLWVAKTKTNVSQALVLTALGNALGVSLGYIVFVYASGGVWSIVLMVLAMGSTALWWASKQKSSWWVLVFIVGVSLGLSVCIYKNWSSNYVVLGYKQFYQNEPLYLIQDTQDFRTIGGEAHVVHLQNGARRVVHGGHSTLTFSADNINTKNRQSVLGLVASLYHPQANSSVAFVGLGTGTSVGAAATVYNEVSVFEINPAMVNLTGTFTEENYNVLAKDNVMVSIQDGLVGLAQTNKKYSAVVNITTRPLFFSANKIHAQEFLAIAKRALKPGGVYVGWLDVLSGAEGLQIYNDTLLSVFAECEYTYLSSGYYAYACSDKLTREQTHPHSTEPEVQKLYQYFPYASIKLGLPYTGHVNSVNYPRLVLFNSMSHNQENFDTFLAITDKRVKETLRSLGVQEREQMCEALSFMDQYPASKNYDECAK